MNALNRLAQATEDRIVGGSDIDVVVQGWFRNMFAIVLPIPVLVRVYDVVVGGSPSILVYVALALLRTQRVRLRSAKSKDAISAALREVRCPIENIFFCSSPPPAPKKKKTRLRKMKCTTSWTWH